MCAMVYDRYGGPDVLCMRKVPVPEQQDGEGLDPGSAMRVSIQPTRKARSARSGCRLTISGRVTHGAVYIDLAK
jgi:hypothetical protein